MEFLNGYIGRDFIDFLWMDIEGAEYGIMELFASTSFNVTVCQVNMEIHGHLEDYGISGRQFKFLIVSLLKNSEFLPIHSVNMGWHIRVFFLNYRRVKCLEKFLKNN